VIVDIAEVSPQLIVNTMRMQPRQLRHDEQRVAVGFDLAAPVQTASQSRRTRTGGAPPNPNATDPRESDTCPDGKCQARVAQVVAGVTGTYIVYRCVRMIPSLFPLMWWSIPENLAIP
jgi:hypothetical protein